MPNGFRCGFLAGLALLCLAAPAVAARVDRILVDFPEAATADGSVMVGTQSLGFFCSPSGPCFDFAAARRCEAGTCSDLLGGIFEDSAKGVSADGTVVVGKSLDTISGFERAARWDSGVMTLLPEGAFPGTFAAALGVSADGNTVVGYADPASVRWVGALPPEDLGNLGAGLQGGFAQAADATGGVIVGRAESPAGGFEAYRWEGGSMTGLGDLAGGLLSSSALALSADASIIVGFATGPSGRRAVRWVGGAMEELHPEAFEAHGISPNGSYIVGSGASGAFRWDATGGLRWVTDLLLEQSVPVMSPLLVGFAVSDDGQIVSGASTGEGFVVDLLAPSPVPLPLWVSLWGFALVVASGRQRLRR